MALDPDLLFERLSPCPEDLSLAGERSHAWTDYRTRDDGRIVTVVFSFGPPWRFRRTQVEETDERVVVTVYLGVHPGVASQMERGEDLLVTPVLMHAVATVRTRDPVESREVVDGSLV